MSGAHPRPLEHRAAILAAVASSSPAAAGAILANTPRTAWTFPEMLVEHRCGYHDDERQQQESRPRGHRAAYPAHPPAEYRGEVHDVRAGQQPTQRIGVVETRRSTTFRRSTNIRRVHGSAPPNPDSVIRTNAVNSSACGLRRSGRRGAGMA